MNIRNLPLLALAAGLTISTAATAQTTAPSPGRTPMPTATPMPMATATPAPRSTATPAQSGTPTATTPVQAGAPMQAGTPAAANPTVGGAPMVATRTIVQNASAAPNLSTLVSAVTAADLAATLSGPGPFTVFAPTNDAFGRLPPATVADLLKPENKPSLVKVLTYHVVPGTITLEQLRAQIAAGGGTATLTTVEGQPLSVTAAGGAITLTDVNGNKSYVETPDVRQSNGVVHVVNGVLVPKLG